MAIEKTLDVTALGELLVDFTQNGDSAQGNPLFEANPGGAPCNVLSMLARLGHKVSFVGKVGEDMFGRMLRDRAAEQGIDMSGLKMDKEVHTTLAFVQKLPNGDRDFSFYRKPGADVCLTAAEVQEDRPLIEGARLFHFGTLSMTDPAVAEATKEALRIAKEAGDLVTFDPNYREPLWESEAAAKEAIAFGMSQCDVMKISDNEIELMTGTTDIEKGVRQLQETYKIPLIFATLGKDGAMAFHRDKNLCVRKAGFVNEKTIETTGAGDTFCACALHYVLTYGLDGLGEKELTELLTFANAAASLITTRKGALAVMPTKEEVEAFLKERGE
ncbi:MAG: carbohydrate kinase [Lachnospiraceae bacterium]